MAPEKKQNTDRIEALKQRLIATKDISKIRPEKVHKLTREALDVPKEWSQKSTKVMKKGLKHPTFFKKFFIFSILIFVASVVFAYIYLTGGNNLITNKKIDLEVLGNSFVSGGEKANFDIIIVNRNAVNLELASLLIKYDKGIGTKIPASERLQIGTISPGETKRLPYELPVIGQEGDIKDITFDLEYRIASSDALFVKTTSTQITLRSSVLGIGIDAPTISSPNQTYTMKISVSPSGNESLSNMALKVEYPPGFNFTSSTPETFSGKNIWYIGDLTPTTPQSITITGSLNGFNEEERVFRVYAGEFDRINNDINPVYISKIHSVILNKPLLSARINESSQIVPIQTGQSVPVYISWQNNTDKSVRDIEISATISGSAYDSSAVIPGEKGEFNQSKNTIIWDSRVNDRLSLVQSGESGSVNFSFIPKAPILINSTSKEVVVTVSIKGTPLDSVSEVKEVSSVDTKTYRLGTNVALNQSVLYQSGPITNSGSMQPVIGSPTTYSVLWVLSNSESLVTNTQVRAILNKNFEWVGTTSPTNENISYNPTSREIIWNVGDLQKNPGPNIRRQVYFQVKLTPTQAMFGSVPSVLDRTLFSGFDTMNNSNINQSKAVLNLSNVEGNEIRVGK